MKDIVRRSLELEQEFVELRRQIHMHPEIAFEEKETSRLVTEKLRSFGIEVKTFPNSTAVVGVIRGTAQKKNPEFETVEYHTRTIALRADMDALKVEEKSGLSYASRNPGKCHACGHDLHTAALLFAAKLLSEYKDCFSGNVKLIFQPAEEGQNGAKILIANGVLANPKVDLIVAAHTWPELEGGKIGFRYGSMMAASDRFRIIVKGKGGHGAHPEQCIDPIMISAYILTELQTIVSREIKPTDAAVVTIGQIHAGTTANVIPAEAIMEGTVRTLKPETRAFVHRRVIEKVEQTAAVFGASAECTFTLGGPPLVNDRRVVDSICLAAEETLGREKMVELLEPSLGGEDFAQYMQLVPGALFRIGTGYDDPASRLSLHNSAIKFDERAIRTAAVVMAQFALREAN